MAAGVSHRGGGGRPGGDPGWGGRPAGFSVHSWGKVCPGVEESPTPTQETECSPCARGFDGERWPLMTGLPIPPHPRLPALKHDVWALGRGAGHTPTGDMCALQCAASTREGSREKWRFKDLSQEGPEGWRSGGKGKGLEEEWRLGSEVRGCCFQQPGHFQQNFSCCLLHVHRSKQSAALF